MHRIHLMGIDTPPNLPAEKLTVLGSCATLFAAGRFLGVLRPALAVRPDTRILPIAPVQEALSRIQEALAISDVAVLVGGDPLFFGIGRTLCRRFGEENVSIYPAVSSMQLAFARFRIPWDDACFISVHGRGMDDLVQRIGTSAKVCLLTDAKNSPAVIAASLLERVGKRAGDYIVHVAENLGQENERLTTSGLLETAGDTFSALNIMILIRKDEAAQNLLPRFGLGEQEILHSRGLITKNEVRAATLHALRLPDTGVFWDIGAGSGSVSLEAARMFPQLKIFAVESKAEQIENIRANRMTFGAYAIQLIHGSASGVLDGLPDPERIFVGGNGGELREILEEGTRRLKPGGILVVNGVIEKTRLVAPEVMHRLGLTVSIATIRVSRCSYPENQSIELNPIAIISGYKPAVTV